MPSLPAPVSHGAPVASPLEALTSGVRQRQISAEGRAAWQVLLRCGVGTLAVLLCAVLPGVVRNFLMAPLALASFLVVAVWLLRSPGLRRVWLGALVATGLVLVFGGGSALGQVLFGTAGTLFLILRRYRPLREIGSRRRGLVFLFGVAAWIALIAVPGASEAEGWFAGGAMRVAKVSRYLLALFWALSAAHLFLGIRLHFLRLRPKLAIAGFLIAAVPVGLLLSLGIFGVFGALGGARSTQARSAMEDWERWVGQDAFGASSGLFDLGFGELARAAGIDDTPPAWEADLREAATTTVFDPFPESGYVHRDGELWLVRFARGDDGVTVRGGWRVTTSTLDQLATRLRARVELLDPDGDFDLTIGSSTLRTGADALGTGRADGVVLCGNPLAAGETVAAPVDSSAGFFDRYVLFGGAPLSTWRLVDTQLEKGNVLLALHTRPRDLLQGFTSDENPINQAVGAALIVFVVFFLVLQLLALYFGLRIVGGITGAVHGLHRATERLARGDLDTWIELPNEDEFGDLASSFNEMTGAIRVAQDHILEKHKMEQELATARRIQERLLPDAMPVLDGWQITGSSDPTLQVGGDYFDFLHLPDGRLGIAIGDVTGKGVPAALLMANLQACLQGQVIHPQDTASTITRMNDLLAASTDPHMFVTFVYAELDPRTGHMITVNAGHEPLLIVRTSGEIEHLRGGGLILGMLPDQSYIQVETHLDPGDVMVAYTDGITEAMGPMPDGSIPRLPSADDPDDDDDDDDLIEVNFFDLDRLVNVVKEHSHRSAEDIRTSVLAAVRRHVRDVPQSDDITLVVIKRDAA